MINDQYFNQELVLQKIFRLFLMMFKIKPFDRMNSFHSGLLCMHILKYAADICSSLVILFIMRSALSCLPCCRRISRVRFKVQRRAENTSTALCNRAAAPVLYSTHMRTKVYLHASWKHVWFIFFECLFLQIAKLWSLKVSWSVLAPLCISRSSAVWAII